MNIIEYIINIKFDIQMNKNIAKRTILNNVDSSREIT